MVVGTLNLENLATCFIVAPVNFCNLCWGVDSVAKSKAHANCLYPYTVDMWTWNGYDQDIFVHDSKWDTNAMQC